ncbi:PadR family transcriptional regulator [Streptomyces sp. NRRL S-1022]|uniref:PadR family transcriptional regulator n=1 Tax=Streptomyces sp. NRRL S-1022 TaxID=1463880 RepID=UPI00068DB29D|nr:PadR family transcriptional regulator [Streptomyces sp. NRRL S-1022]
MSDNLRFSHGEIRHHLLALLDQQPSHGYGLLTKLSERFAGAYRPSPGTVYPRLRQLEAEGLLSHETANGHKVYRLTPAGRQELERLQAAESPSRTAGRPVGQGAAQSPAAPAAPVENLSDPIRSAVEEIVGDFRKQFGSARERPPLGLDEHRGLSWIVSLPPDPQPSARMLFQQRLDDLTTAAQQLLRSGSTPDDVLWEGARLLEEVTAKLGRGGPTS